MKLNRLCIILFLFAMVWHNASVAKSKYPVSYRLLIGSSVGKYYENTKYTSSPNRVLIIGLSPGFQIRPELQLGRLNFGVQFALNQYQKWRYFDYSSGLKPHDSWLDSIHGKVRYTTMSFVFGYTFIQKEKVKMSLMMRFGGKPHVGYNKTVGRFHKDSIVFGQSIYTPKSIYGLNLNFEYKINSTISAYCELFGYKSKVNTAEEMNIPDELLYKQNYIEYGGNYFGLGLGLVYAFGNSK